MFAFFNDLHIDLSVAIERRENFDAMTDRETIFAQNIDFFDVAIDKNSENVSKEIASEATTDFDDVNDEKIIDRNDVENFDSKANETTNC